MRIYLKILVSSIQEVGNRGEVSSSKVKDTSSGVYITIHIAFQEHLQAKLTREGTNHRVENSGTSIEGGPAPNVSTNTRNQKASRSIKV